MKNLLLILFILIDANSAWALAPRAFTFQDTQGDVLDGEERGKAAKDGIGKRGKFDLDRAIRFISDRFKAEPSRSNLPSQEEIAIELGVGQMTVSHHWETILAELQRLKDPRIESAILLWRQREASEGKFNLEQAISFIEDLFQAEPSRLNLPSQEEIAAHVGVIQMTVSYHWEMILAELQRLKDPRIESAILLWRQQHLKKRGAPRGKFNLEQAVSSIEGLFKSEPSRSNLPSQEEIATELGVEQKTVFNHWETILAELQRLNDPRIESAILLWRQQHLKKRGAPRGKFNLEQAVSFIEGLFQAEPSRLSLPSQEEIATHVGVEQKTVSEHWETILVELQRLNDPRIESAILLWRQREASEGKFNLEQAVSFIEGLFKAEPSRSRLPSQREIAAQLGVSMYPVSYHWETILTKLQELKDPRIQTAILLWREDHGKKRGILKGKFNLEEAVGFIEGLFKSDPSRSNLPSQRMIAAALGVGQTTVFNHWEMILAELERLQNQRISDAISRWKESYRGATLTLAQLGLTRQWDESLGAFVIGRPLSRAADEEIVQQETAEIVSKAIDSLPKRDQEICRRILDVLAEGGAESLDMAELGEATGFSQKEIAEVFLRLRNTPQLQRLAEAWGIGGAKEGLESPGFLDTSI